MSGYLGSFVGPYLGAYIGAFEDRTVTYEDYVGVLDDSAGAFAYRGQVDDTAHRYRGTCDTGDGYIGIVNGDGYSYRGSVEPDEEEVRMFSMVVGDRSPSLTRILKNAETDEVVDLSTATGVTVAFRIGTSGTLKTGTATVVTAASGIVRYDWAAFDLDDDGTCYLRFIATFPTGRKQTFPSDGGYFEFPVSA